MSPLLHALLRDPFSASVGRLAVAVIYEDSHTHREATVVYELLLKELEENAALTATWWRTSLLGDPKLSRVAARAVAGSDLILISIRANRKPSILLKAWIESWPAHADNSAQLVALLHDRGNHEVTTEWVTYLQEIARMKNLGYLEGSTGLATTSTDCPSRRTVVEKVPTLNDRRFEPFVHGGLNE